MLMNAEFDPISRANDTTAPTVKVGAGAKSPVDQYSGAVDQLEYCFVRFGMSSSK